MKEFWKKKWVQIGGLVLATIVIMYTMIYFDVVSRAKESYLEGDKYWSWYENPELKKKALEEQFTKEGKELAQRLKPNIIDTLLFGKKKITEEEYNRELEAMKFDHQRQLEESSVKYAYVWYQTAVELFSPPESKWVKLARQKKPVAKEKWKEELRAKGVPFEDYMLE